MGTKDKPWKPKNRRKKGKGHKPRKKVGGEKGTWYPDPLIFDE